MASVEKRHSSAHSDFLSSLKETLNSKQQAHSHPGELHTSPCLTSWEPMQGHNRTVGNEEAKEEEEEVTLMEDDRPVVLVTNDDGINAPGLRALVNALVDAGRCKVFVCAPDSEKSGAGHSISTRESVSVNSVEMRGAIAFEVAGTPVDCVSLSLSGMLLPWKKPSLVLSGINKGSNCGYHIIYSGTVAAAREAFMCGIPSISLSLNWKKGESCESNFQAAADVCLPLIHAALHDVENGVFPNGFFLNVDVPTNPLQHKGLRLTRQGTSLITNKWRVSSCQRHLSTSGIGREQGIGIQLAQLGLAASAAGAARRLNSPFKITEIESVASADKGNSQNDVKKTLYFRREMIGHEAGETNEENDFGCLELGYISVTPLGLTTSLDLESLRSATKWISSIALAGLSTL